MTEKLFFADVDTPFHVWVREHSGAHGFRWVLRHASQVIASGARHAPASESRQPAGKNA